MAVHYFCRYCGIKLGTIEENVVDFETLGFHKLTEQERENMLQYEPNGDVNVKSICENCHESFTINPSNHENDYIIH